MQHCKTLLGDEISMSIHTTQNEYQLQVVVFVVRHCGKVSRKGIG
jgi:hypothetical protein